jgi:hypothetical protein
MDHTASGERVGSREHDNDASGSIKYAQPSLVSQKLICLQNTVT